MGGIERLVITHQWGKIANKIILISLGYLELIISATSNFGCF